MASVRARKYAQGLCWEGWYRDRRGKWRGFNTKIAVGGKKSKSAALELTAFIEGQIQAGADPFRLDTLTPDGPSFSAAWAEFVALKKLTVRKGTVSLYQQTGQAFLTTVGDPQVAELTADSLLKFAELRLRQRTDRVGRTVQPTTVNRNLRDLRAFLGWCQERGWIARLPRVRLLKQERDEVRFFSPDQMEKLLAAAREVEISGVRFDLFLRVLLWSALRIGEALSLSWENVDLAYRQLAVPGKRTKTGKPVYVPLSLPLLETLKALPKPRRGPLFPWSQASGHLHACWQQTVARAGVPYLKLHALRHTAATMLVDAGLKPHQLQQMLHASLATTLKYYVGTDRAMMEDAARKIGAGRYSTIIQRNGGK